MIWLQWLIFFVSMALQVYVIGLLRRGAYKDYPFVFFYSLVLIMTTVADGAVYADIGNIRNWSHDFYRNEAVRQLLLFTVVMSLMDRAMRHRPYRARIRTLLAFSAFTVVLISVQVHREAHYTLWATQVGRDLSFGSVILTLLLWVTLISSSGRKDTQLLMVTGGLGLQFTGEAIGQSLRQMSVPHHYAILLFAGNFLLIASHLMRLYVWSEAFRRPRSYQEENKKPDDDIPTFRRQAQHSLLAESI
jgi:hypothetical protein